MRPKHKQAEEMKREGKLMGCEESEQSRVIPGVQPAQLQSNAFKLWNHLDHRRSPKYLSATLNMGSELLGDFAVVQHYRRNKHKPSTDQSLHVMQSGDALSLVWGLTTCHPSTWESEAGGSP